MKEKLASVICNLQQPSVTHISSSWQRFTVALFTSDPTISIISAINLHSLSRFLQTIKSLTNLSDYSFFYQINKLEYQPDILIKYWLIYMRFSFCHFSDEWKLYFWILSMWSWDLHLYMGLLMPQHMYMICLSWNLPLHLYIKWWHDWSVS